MIETNCMAASSNASGPVVMTSEKSSDSSSGNDTKSDANTTSGADSSSGKTAHGHLKEYVPFLGLKLRTWVLIIFIFQFLMILGIWGFQNYRIDTQKTMRTIQNDLFVSFCWDFLDSYDYKLRKKALIDKENEELDWEEFLDEAKLNNPNYPTNPLFETQQKIQFKLKRNMQMAWDDAEQRKNFQELVQKTTPSAMLDKESLMYCAEILNKYHWMATQRLSQ